MFLCPLINHKFIVRIFHTMIQVENIIFSIACERTINMRGVLLMFFIS